MNLTELVKEIETEFPSYRWLLRDGGSYKDGGEAEYMAHIFDESERNPITYDFIKTYVCYADTPEEAMTGALNKALRYRVAAKSGDDKEARDD